MGGAQNPEAVRSIKKTCISKVSISINSTQFTNILGHISIMGVGAFNTGYGEPSVGMLIKIDNNILAPITGVSFSIKNKNTQVKSYHTVTKFVGLQRYGTIITGPGDPILEQSIAPGTTETFVVEVPGIGVSLPAFLAAHDWYLEDMKVIPPS